MQILTIIPLILPVTSNKRENIMTTATTATIDFDRIIQLEKQLNLARFLDCLPSEIEEGYDDCTFEYGGSDWKVYTDDEANEAFAESIEQSVWAFNSDFMAGETGIDCIVFERLSELCESANDAVLSIIRATCGFDDFVKAARCADGRGHSLSSYDGEECDYNDYFIYRS
jgi:hypothetical protein